VAFGGRLGRAQAFQHRASLGDLHGLLERDRPDTRAAVALPGHQPEALQVQERLPDGPAAGREALGELGLHQPLPG
jgi:hypothetical protein